MDDSIDGAHSLLGAIYQVKGQYDKAFSEAERAVSLNPNGADAHMILAGIVGCLGRWEESVLYAKKSIRLNPVPQLSNFFVLGRAYFMTSHYDEAIVELKKAVQMNADFLLGHIYLAECYSSMGRDVEVNAELREVLRINPKFCVESYAKTLPYKDKADIEREVAALRKAGLK
jgi:adenylate cyclase